MTDHFYGIWLICCLGIMIVGPIVLIAIGMSVYAMSPVLIGSALMLLGRCAWKWKKLSK